MDKDIYGGVADSRPLSREKCHTSGLSEERETSEEKYTTGSIYMEKYGGNWRKIGEEVGEK